MGAIWRREWKSYFITPVGYVFMGVFLSLAALMFYLSILRQHSGDLPTFMGQIGYLWMLLSPILSMRLMAEDRQRGTDQLLYTSPASLISIVTGKYLAALTVMAMTALMTFVFVGVVAVYGTVYLPEIGVAYLGFMLQGAAFLSVGIYLSALSKTPVTAAIFGFGANFLLWMMDLLADVLPKGAAVTVLRFLSIYQRTEPFLLGQLSLASILYEISFVLVFLALTVHAADSRRYKGG